VWYIEPIDPPSEKENKTGRTLHRSNTINTKYTTGRHYNGEGINIMMQDDGIIGPHIDYQGRIDQSNCGGCSTSNSNDHGDHVAGTIMGSGNLDPIAAGMSDAAFLYVYSSSNNNYYDVPLIYQHPYITISYLLKYCYIRMLTYLVLRNILTIVIIK
jgi:subtilisin family serine protease